VTLRSMVVDQARNPSGTSHAVRRAHLLDAVVAVIARRGLERTRFQDVAAEAGVSIGTLQHYFGSRQTMILEAIRWSVDPGEEDLPTAGVGDPWERLQMVLARGTDGGETREDWWRVWIAALAAAVNDPLIAETVTDAYRAWSAPLTAIIADGIAQSRFRTDLDPAAAAGILLAAMDGIALQSLTQGTDHTTEVRLRGARAFATALLGVDGAT